MSSLGQVHRLTPSSMGVSVSFLSSLKKDTYSFWHSCLWHLISCDNGQVTLHLVFGRNLDYFALLRTTGKEGLIAWTEAWQASPQDKKWAVTITALGRTVLKSASKVPASSQLWWVWKPISNVCELLIRIHLHALFSEGYERVRHTPSPQVPCAQIRPSGKTAMCPS